MTEWPRWVLYVEASGHFLNTSDIAARGVPLEGDRLVNVMSVEEHEDALYRIGQALEAAVESAFPDDYKDYEGGQKMRRHLLSALSAV